MGRMFYQVPKSAENDRAVHVLSTELGTIVLAMREPQFGERGYSVGVDFTVRAAVREMLADWDPGTEGPGWLATAEVIRDRTSHVAMPRHLSASSSEETYDVTILAAYELDEHERTARGLADLDEAEKADAASEPAPSCNKQALAEIVLGQAESALAWRFRITDGEYKGTEFAVREEDRPGAKAAYYRARGRGAMARVEFCPDDQFAKLVEVVL